MTCSPSRTSRARGARPIEENRVEHGAAQRETAIAKGAKAVLRGELAANARAIRRADHHPREVRGAR